MYVWRRSRLTRLYLAYPTGRLLESVADDVLGGGLRLEAPAFNIRHGPMAPPSPWKFPSSMPTPGQGFRPLPSRAHGQRSDAALPYRSPYGYRAPGVRSPESESEEAEFVRSLYDRCVRCSHIKVEFEQAFAFQFEKGELQVLTLCVILSPGLILTTGLRRVIPSMRPDASWRTTSTAG